MVSAVDIAKYFISKDVEKKLFTKNYIVSNGAGFTEGSARVNKYLHLAQNIYIAKHGELLFYENLYAFKNGAVVEEVRLGYTNISNNISTSLPCKIEQFLNIVYDILKDATIEELIDISHEDPEWVDKSRNATKQAQKMNSINRTIEYKEHYSDILILMSRMFNYE